MSLEAPENEELSIQTQTQSFQFFVTIIRDMFRLISRRYNFDCDLFPMFYRTAASIKQTEFIRSQISRLFVTRDKKQFTVDDISILFEHDVRGNIPVSVNHFYKCYKTNKVSLQKINGYISTFVKILQPWRNLSRVC